MGKDSKKISESKKVELLEEAIAFGSSKEVSLIIEKFDSFEFLPRAFGIACLFGDLDKVKLLVELGASFEYEYDSTMVRKYGCGYSTKYMNHTCEYELLVLGEIIDVFIPSAGVTSKKYHFGRFPEFDCIPVDILNERIRIVEYLFANKEKVKFDAENVLYYSILWGVEPIAECLISKGCKLSTKAKNALSSGHSSGIRSEFFETIYLLDEDKCAYVFKRLSDLLDAEKAKIRMTSDAFSEYTYSKFAGDVVKIVVERTDTSKLKKYEIVESLADDYLKNNELKYLVEKGWIKTSSQMMDIINIIQDRKDKELYDWLVEYKSKTFGPDVETKKKSVNQDESKVNTNTVAEIKKRWDYQKKEDGSLILTSYKGKETELVIPSKIGRSEVSEIGKNAVDSIFYGNATNNKVRAEITTVVIPDGIKIIGVSSFGYLSKLQRVEIPDSVTTIEDFAFAGCENLKDIKIPNTVSLGRSVFNGCKKLSDANGCGILGDMLVTIDTKREAIVVPEGVSRIAPDAFDRSNIVNRITLPNSIRIIGPRAFFGCNHVEELIIPYGIEVIEEGTFSRCRMLNSISIPSSVTTIKRYAFESCNSLAKITIPSSVIKIDKNAFAKKMALFSNDKIENLDVIICGEVGSEAERFAKENGFAFEACS